MTTKALALLSGGLDSILAKAAAREKAPTYHLGGGNCTSTSEVVTGKRI